MSPPYAPNSTMERSHVLVLCSAYGYTSVPRRPSVPPRYLAGEPRAKYLLLEVLGRDARAKIRNVRMLTMRRCVVALGLTDQCMMHCQFRQLQRVHSAVPASGQKTSTLNKGTTRTCEVLRPRCNCYTFESTVVKCTRMSVPRRPRPARANCEL